MIELPGRKSWTSTKSQTKWMSAFNGGCKMKGVQSREISRLKEPMDSANGDAVLCEAFSVMGQYLSDTVPPVQAADAVTDLMGRAPETTASEILRWISARFQGADGSMSDYVYHAASKLRYLSHLELIPAARLTPWVEGVERLLVTCCPPEERATLLEYLGHLALGQADLDAPVDFIQRRMRSPRPGGDDAGAEARERRMRLLERRLEEAVRSPVSPRADSGGEGEGDAVPHLIANAITHVRSSGELARLQENLRALGIEAGTDQIFRKLGQSLPGWMIATTGDGAVDSRNPAVEAMRQVIRLAENRWDGYRRFQDMVQAAVEQFNAGSLARAATMLDLALEIGSGDSVDADAVAGVRQTAHASLNPDLLRGIARERDRRPLLGRVLGFFEEYSVPKLLERLRTEDQRDRRRLLLDLLEVHGAPARRLAFERLGETGVDLAADWHFTRNLITILSLIPSPGEVPPGEEIARVAPLTRLDLPAPLVREAIKFAGQTRCPEAESLLLRLTEELEAAAPGRPQALSLLDRTIYALAQQGTPKANLRVARHGTGEGAKLGETAARLGYLGNRDLGDDRETLSLLLRTLKDAMPKRIFGLTLQKNEALMMGVIRALSSTPDPAVRQLLETIASRNPGERFGEAAGETLRGFDSAERAGSPAERTLAGDLDLFGLPDLLRRLAALEATGMLVLRSPKDTLTGTLGLVAGGLESCTAGRLEGVEAACQLLERPAPGTFSFQGRKEVDIHLSGADRGNKAGVHNLHEVLAEGMRRYDELQRARGLVPDFALLRRKGPEPVPEEEPGAQALAAQIWPMTADGVTPKECEGACSADACRVRRLLARWVEEGILDVG